MYICIIVWFDWSTLFFFFDEDVGEKETLYIAGGNVN
jgi:hypothetical protein